MTNNLTTPFPTDIADVEDVDADQNEGLVFFTIWKGDKIYRMNYVTHDQIIVIKYATGELWKIITINM